MKKSIWSRSFIILSACIVIILVLSLRLFKIQTDDGYSEKLLNYQQAMLQNFDEPAILEINSALCQNKKTYALYFYTERVLSKSEQDDLIRLLLPLLNTDENSLRQSLQATTPQMLQNVVDFEIIDRVQKGQIPYCYLELNTAE